MRALYFQTDKETCLHNNSLRKVHTDNIQHLSKAISKVVIHTYFKNHVAPTIKEGFGEIIEIPYVEVALDEKEQRQKMKSLEKATVDYKPFILEENL